MGEDTYNYVTNTDEQTVLDADFIAFYKGRLVIKLPIGTNAASFGILFIGDKVSDTKTVQHEYGHTVQFRELGLFDFTVQVAIPSITCNLVDRANKLPYKYYNSPWEYQADIYGDVIRENYYTEWAGSVGETYNKIGRIISSITPF